MTRYFTRCTVCLVIAAIGERPASNAVCGLCDGPIENMGRVERDRLIDEHLACKCDDRCTSARGPHCTCKCGAVNHGAGLLGGYELVKTDKGPVPTVTPSAGKEQATINAREYRTAREALRAMLDPLLASKARGFLPRGEWERLRDIQAALRALYHGKVHASRMKQARRILPAGTIGELARAIQDAPKVAEAPYALRSTPAPTVQPKQERMF